MAHTVSQLAIYAVLLIGYERWPAVHAHLMHHLVFAPCPLFVVRAVWCLLIGPFSGWAFATGAAAAALLALHFSRDPSPDPNASYGGAGARQRSGASGSGAGAGAPVAHLSNTVPAGAPEAVARILQAGNYYEVLGLGSDADATAIKTAKRTLTLATHPDKIGTAPGGNDAFNLVIEACDVLGDAASRQQYDQELQDSALSSGFNFSPEDLEASGIPPEWMDRMQEFMDAVDAGDIPQQCSHCGGLHFMRKTERPMAAARQCDECGTRHPVRQHEVWFESSSAGFMRRTINMYCCYKGVVYDMSESAACEGTLQLVVERRFPMNKHLNFFKGFGLSTSGGGGGGKRSKQSQPTPRSQGPRGGGGKKKGRRR